MTPLSIIPRGDFERFSRLNSNAREEWERVANALLAIDRALARKEATMNALLSEWSRKIGLAASTLRRRWDLWRHSKDWKSIVNGSLAGPDWQETDRAPLPPEFIDCWQGLCGRNQRGKHLTQHRALLRRLAAWRMGDVAQRIPGYDTPPANAEGKNYPAGWSYRNLMRCGNKPKAAEMALVTIGVSAALKLLPGIPGSRTGSRFLEYVTIDDVWQDRKVFVPGHGPRRLLQMGAMDYASGVYLKFGLRPELPTEADATVRERLKEVDALRLIAAMLEEYGYPADYDMHLICERGTATVRPPEAQALYDISGGRIKVCYTSMEGGLVLVWQDSSTGNSRGKGWHESWHNLFHNEMATIPGQVGKDPAHQPATLAAMEREARSLATASHFLAETDRAGLKFPFPGVEEAHGQTLDVIARINRRTEHDCEGFDKVLEWVIPGADMRPQAPEKLLALEPALREAVEYRPRLESPLERLAKLRSGIAFNKIPSGLLCRLYVDSHALRPIKDYRFTATVSGRNYVFKAPTPADELPEDGREYLGYFAPHDPACVHLTHKGGYVATWIRERRIQRGDQKAVGAAIAEKTGHLNRAMGAVRRQQADFIAGEDRRLRDNNRLLSEGGLLPAIDCGPGQTVSMPGAIAPLQRAAEIAAAAKAAQPMPALTEPAPAPVADNTAELLERAETGNKEAPDWD